MIEIYSRYAIYLYNEIIKRAWNEIFRQSSSLKLENNNCFYNFRWINKTLDRCSVLIVLKFFLYFSTTAFLIPSLHAKKRRSIVSNFQEQQFIAVYTDIRIKKKKHRSVSLDIRFVVYWFLVKLNRCCWYNVRFERRIRRVRRVLSNISSETRSLHVEKISRSDKGASFIWKTCISTRLSRELRRTLNGFKIKEIGTRSDMRNRWKLCEKNFIVKI